MHWPGLLLSDLSISLVVVIVLRIIPCLNGATGGSENDLLA